MCVLFFHTCTPTPLNKLNMYKYIEGRERELVVWPIYKSGPQLSLSGRLHALSTAFIYKTPFSIRSTTKKPKRSQPGEKLFLGSWRAAANQSGVCWACLCVKQFHMLSKLSVFLSFATSYKYMKVPFTGSEHSLPPSNAYSALQLVP